MKQQVLDKLGRAEGFAREWLAAWNAHDIDRIIGHYAPDATVQSPFLAQATGDARGCVTGAEQLRAIYGKALLKYPDLEFRVIRVLAGMESVVIHYHTVEGLLAAETFLLDGQGRAHTVLCHYCPES
ncbi:MAG TPA: nuclear transport factor 2 family protein [Gammaproteobacteria bacterium]